LNKGKNMNKKILPAALPLLLILTACAGTPAATETPPTQPAADSPTEAVVHPTDIPAADEDETTDPIEPTSETAAENSSAQVSFSSDVMPILQTYCIECHGGRRIREGLDMRTHESLLNGSRHGPVLTPGDANESLFIELIVKGEMPDRGPKVTPAELQMLIDWVNQGALNN
jgi:hypothetical protein